jgi:cytochrome c oxidase assembly protein subunit 15
MRSSSVPKAGDAGGTHYRWLHRFAVFTACCAFCLIIAGGLVTSNDAGLAVPDWPLSYGKLMPPMVGGIFYEHGHRMVATFVGFLTIILAIWTSRVEPRAWVRRLAWINLGGIIAQGLLGGLTVLYFLPAPISIAHASLAQAIFCVTVTLAVVTGGGWLLASPGGERPGSTGLRVMAFCLVAALYVQLVLGAATRHSALGVIPHIAGAVVVLGLLFSIVVQTGRHFSWEWKQRAYILLGVTLTQIFLGIATLMVKISSVNAPQPTPERVWSATSHVALGALLLALSLVFALRIQRHFGKPEPAPGQRSAGRSALSRPGTALPSPSGGLSDG